MLNLANRMLIKIKPHAHKILEERAGGRQQQKLCRGERERERVREGAYDAKSTLLPF